MVELLAEEASETLGATIEIDTLRPTQASTSAIGAAVATLLQAMARAKESGLEPWAVASALPMVLLEI